SWSATPSTRSSACATRWPGWTTATCAATARWRRSRANTGSSRRRTRCPPSGSRNEVRMKQQPNNERPADLAVQDSVGGMARRLLDPAHLRDLARRSAATLREQGAEQLWRDVTFRVGLAFHHDDWRHRADLPLRRTLKAQRAAALQGPCI